MKLQPAPSALSPALAALARALGPDGASPLGADVPEELWQRALAAPAAEFLARPGKQLRTTIVRAGWLLGGGAADSMPEGLPLVIELLHAGSLIIDDVQDESHERRGEPTLHRLVGVALAINTGSWMYFWGLTELTKLGLPATTEHAAMRAATAALVRCHQGQALDLAVRIADLDVGDAAGVVAATTRLKTGTLCALAAELGAIAAGAVPAVRAAIATFGMAMGTGLQMLDDLGSLTSPARRHKGREDLRAGRPTWPWAWLADQGPFGWSRLAAMARMITSDGEHAELDARLDELADELVTAVRPFGQLRIRATLDDALAALVAVVGDSSVTSMIDAELRRMEDSYA